MHEWDPEIGCTLHIPSGPTGNHLFVILFGPMSNESYGLEQQFLLVPLCTATSRSEPSCIVRLGEHPFVKHKSYIDYAVAEIRSESSLKQSIISGAFQFSDKTSSELLEKIRSGFSQSKAIKRHIKNDFSNYF